MYKIKYIAIFSFLIAFSSCKKFLAVEPKESVSDNQTIFDKTSAEEAVRGIYSALGDAGYYGTSFQSIGYLSGDNVQWTGSQSQVQEFINHNVRADNSTISAAWSQIYVTINRANQVIAKLPAVEDIQLSESYKNQLLGEAYFLRGLAYFDLARTWGGVPLILTPTLTATDNTGIKRNSQAETYAQVLADLNKAEALLPVTTNSYRATAKTVWALKARYYLYQKDWANAETYANKLIEDNTSYSLVKPYSAFFANNVRGTSESVFEIYYNGTTETNGHGVQWLPQTLGGTRQWAPADTLITLINDASIGGNRNSLVAQDNQNRWYATLYGSVNASGTYVIRIAELYLIRAEARTEQNNLEGALNDLNAIRNRAGLISLQFGKPATATTPPVQDQQDILLAIENERRIEFAFEPHRWFDLVRTDRAKTVLTFTGATDPETIANRYLMPIPAQEIQLDPVLLQNPGYN